MSRFCVLGAGGCFGTNTAQHLLTQGHEVLGVGRFPPKAAPFSLELHHPRYRYKALHVVTELDLLLELFEEFKPEVIINYAALAEVPLSWTHPARYAETNYVALVRLLKSITGKPWLRKFVQIGSSEVYGSNNHPVDEDAPIRCSSPYAVSKAAGDLHLMTLKDIPWILIRPSNCYCPGQLLHRVIPRAVVCGLAGERMPLHGGGYVKKSYMHATDLSVAIDRLSLADVTGVFNCGVSTPVAIRDLVLAVAARFEKSLEEFCEITEGRKVEDACFWIDSSKLRSLGWEPRITLREGIEDMIRWGRKYERELTAASPAYEMRA